MSKCEGRTNRMSEWQKLCVLQTVRQITGFLSANSTCVFNLYGDQWQESANIWFSKLKQDSKRQAFINDIRSRLDALEHSSEDLDENWTVLRDTVYSSAMDSLGQVSRKHQDWFDENDEKIQGISGEKHKKKHKAYLSDISSVSSKTTYSNICKTVQSRLGDMQLQAEIQSFADRKDMKFFDTLKTVYGPHSQGIYPSFMQIKLVFGLTKKLSRKDGLKLSADYHRWTVIHCLMSYQPSLKQWKQ